jgi:hypothetical protein
LKVHPLKDVHPKDIKDVIRKERQKQNRLLGRDTDNKE